MTDEQREQQIKWYGERAIELADEDRDASRAMFARMMELIQQRSPEQVARMEKARGLA